MLAFNNCARTTERQIKPSVRVRKEVRRYLPHGRFFTMRHPVSGTARITRVWNEQISQRLRTPHTKREREVEEKSRTWAGRWYEIKMWGEERGKGMDEPTQGKTERWWCSGARESNLEGVESSLFITGLQETGFCSLLRRGKKTWKRGKDGADTWIRSRITLSNRQRANNDRKLLLTLTAKR